MIASSKHEKRKEQSMSVSEWALVPGVCYTTSEPSFDSKPTNFLWSTERRNNWTTTTRTYRNIPSTRRSAPETQHISNEVFPKYSLMRSKDSNDLGRGKKKDNAQLLCANEIARLEMWGMRRIWSDFGIEDKFKSKETKLLARKHTLRWR